MAMFRRKKTAHPQARKVSVEAPSAMVEVQYSRSWLTSKGGREAYAHFKQATGPDKTDAEKRQASTVFFALLLTGWDVVNEDGEPIPITQELLAQLPDEWFEALAYALGDDLRHIRGQSSRRAKR